MSASSTGSQALFDVAERVLSLAREHGASESAVSVGLGRHTTLQRREGQIEEATEATSRGLALRLFVDERWSSHSTSDLRPEALERFVQTAVSVTRLLEPDPDRALPPAEACGRSYTDAQLDTLDPAWAATTPEDRAQTALELESAIEAHRDARFISTSAYAADGWGLEVEVTSHGFSDQSEGAWFARGASLTLADQGGRRPEGDASFAARYASDLPSSAQIAAEACQRAEGAVGSGPIASGHYPMLLDARVAGRMIGMLTGPLSGASIHHGRSCLADKLEQKLGSDLLHIVDDPSVPRGLASRPWDGDHRFVAPVTLFDRGVLKQHYLSTYYARKLGRPATTGGASNLVLSPGTKSPFELTRDLDKVIWVQGFLGGNSNPLTGDFSLGIRGQLLEHGEVTANLSEMNVSGNLLDLFFHLAALANDPWRFGRVRSPSLLFDRLPFSGT